MHIEAVWWIIHSAGILAINRGWMDYRGEKSILNEEERWRILRRMLEGDGSNPCESRQEKELGLFFC